MGDFYHKVAAPKCSPLQSLFSGLSSHLHLLHTTSSSQSTSLSDYTSVSLFFSCHKVPHFSLKNATSISMIYPNPPLRRTLSCSHISSWLRNIQWEDAVCCSQRKLPYNHQLITNWSNSSVDAVGFFASFTLAGVPLHYLIALMIWNFILISNNLYTSL